MSEDKRCDICGSEDCQLVPCGDHFHYACVKCAKVLNPNGTHWQCEACGTVYGEYVNGCPKCWDKGIRAKVVGSKTLRTVSNLA